MHSNFDQASTMERAARKRVRFSAVTHIEEIDTVEKSNWYSSKDIKVFQESAVNACFSFRHHRDSVSKSLRRSSDQPLLIDDDLEENEHTIRGLEAIAIPNLGKKRKRQRQRAIKGVLIAQATARDHQETEDDLDVERFIAFFAERESKNAKEFAEMMGKEDESVILRP